MSNLDWINAPSEMLRVWVNDYQKAADCFLKSFIPNYGEYKKLEQQCWQEYLRSKTNDTITNRRI